MNKSYSARNITLGGISTALIVTALFLGIITRNSKLFFLAFATFFGAIPCMLSGVKGGFATYAASVLLSFIILPNKFYTGVFALFGLYPMIKLICEKQGKLREIVYKYLWFNITIAVSYFIYRNLLYTGDFLKQPMGIILLLAGVQILFFIYDYAFTIFITFAKDKIFKEV